MHRKGNPYNAPASLSRVRRSRLKLARTSPQSGSAPNWAIFRVCSSLLCSHSQPVLTRGEGAFPSSLTLTHISAFSCLTNNLGSSFGWVAGSGPCWDWWYLSKGRHPGSFPVPTVDQAYSGLRAAVPATPSAASRFALFPSPCALWVPETQTFPSDSHSPASSPHFPQRMPQGWSWAERCPLTMQASKRLSSRAFEPQKFGVSQRVSWWPPGLSISLPESPCWSNEMVPSHLNADWNQVKQVSTTCYLASHPKL